MSAPMSGNGHRIRRVCIVGGAGFIGSHFVERLLRRPRDRSGTVYDNFSSGRHWHLAAVRVNDPRLTVVEADVEDLESLTECGRAAATRSSIWPPIRTSPVRPPNPRSISTKAPVLTHHVVEAAQHCGGGRILYASGSGVYGDVGDLEAPEDYGPWCRCRPTARPSWLVRR